MQIALEATAACRPRKSGVARYAIQVMQALASLDRTDSGHSDFRYTAYCRLSRARKKGYHLPVLAGVPAHWYQDPLPPWRSKPEVVHGLEVRVPRWRNLLRVATLHDVLSLISTEFASEKSRRHRIADYSDMARRCDHVIAVSECTRNDFLRFHDYPADRVHVTHLGVDARFRPREPGEYAATLQRWQLDRPYLLFVGDLTIRKNLVRLIRAYARSHAAREHDLVVVGAPEHGAEAIGEELNRLELSAGQVRLLGHVPDENVPELYNGASAFLFPTLYEGFGLPVLEAFASGVPVLGADVGAVPEVAGGHAVLIDPTDEDAIREGIEQTLARSPQQVRAAQEHAARFTWERCARETRGIYQLTPVR